MDGVKSFGVEVVGGLQENGDGTGIAQITQARRAKLILASR